MEPLRNTEEHVVARPGAVSGDRRGCARQIVHSPAYVSTNLNFTGTGLELHEILDAGESGIALQGTSQLPVGHRVQLCLDLAETTDPVRTAGRVIWSEPSGRSGIRFLELRGPASKEFKKWLFMNALTACARHAALQALDCGQLDRASSTDANPSSPGEEIGAPTRPDYTLVLTQLAAIRQEAAAASPALDSSLPLLAEYARDFAGASGAAIALSVDDEMICRSSTGSAPGVGSRFQTGTGFSGECVRSGRLLRCDDAETDLRVDHESCRALGIRSMIAVPIQAGDAVTGLLEVFSPQPNAFSLSHSIFLQRLADVILTAVRRSAQTVSLARAQIATPAAPTDQTGNVLGFEALSGGDILSEEIPGEASPEIPPTGTYLGRIALFAAVAVLLVVAALFIRRIGILSGSSQSRAQQIAAPAEAPKTQPEDHLPQGDLDRLRKSAAQGNANAQFALGARYAMGEDVPRNDSTAVQWFALAAEQGQVLAQATLGAYYWEGRGVPQDLDKAYFWSVLARAGGDEASKYRVAGLASRMSRSQIIAAQEEANNWLQQRQLAGKTSPGSHP
jgi:putative methionine-R-sulfoxide reductase with GAF domain